MARGVSSFDVARLAGVSQATVSYVLNQRKGMSVRPETRSRVMDAALSLGYQPNRAARSLAGGRTGTIALWVPLAYHTVFNHFVEQIMALASVGDVHVTIVQTARETAASLLASGHLSTTNVDGIISVDERQLINDVQQMTGALPPIVSIGPAYTDQVDHVGVDTFTGSYEAVRHMIESGCKRVAHATFAGGMQKTDPRYKGYEKAVHEAAMTPEFIILERGEYDDTSCAIRERFASNDRPDGVFCWNDEAAIGANRALADLGLRVPNDVAIVGSDGVRETEFAVPSLTTIAQPFGEMCRLAWAYLNTRIEDPEVPMQATILPTKLIVRQSTGRRD